MPVLFDSRAGQQICQLRILDTEVCELVTGHVAIVLFHADADIVGRTEQNVHDVVRIRNFGNVVLEPLHVEMQFCGLRFLLFYGEFCIQKLKRLLVFGIFADGMSEWLSGERDPMVHENLVVLAGSLHGDLLGGGREIVEVLGFRKDQVDALAG